MIFARRRRGPALPPAPPAPSWPGHHAAPSHEELAFAGRAVHEADRDAYRQLVTLTGGDHCRMNVLFLWVRDCGLLQTERVRDAEGRLDKVFGLKGDQ